MTATTRSGEDKGIAANVAVHDDIAEQYDGRHSEIFNDREQGRLAASLGDALGEVKSAKGDARALDMGCGSGNLTRHLLALGCHVTAADVSQRFLDLVTKRFASAKLATSRLNGRDLSQFEDRSFDLVATYSVLHHIPDYLASVAEMGRVCRVGGVVYIDHEASPDFWSGSADYARFASEVKRHDWRKWLNPQNYYGKVRRMIDPRYTNEGDIHVWPDDHIEWPAIAAALSDNFEVVRSSDYLLFNGLYRADVYDAYQDKLTDTRVTAYRRVR